MRIDRRKFLQISAATGLAATIPAGTHAITVPDPPQPAKLKLPCQEGVAPGKSLQEKLDFLEQHGFVGFEPGGRHLPKRVEELQSALQGRDIKISAICAGFKGVLISEKESVRQQAIASIKEILEAAGALGATGLIVVPAFNGKTKLHHKESRELLLQLLPELGDHAAKNHTRILLEPLNRKEAYFLRLVADAAAICRDANNPGIACMGDFWHMTWEETSDTGAFLSGGKFLHHVHIASRKRRKMPGEDEGDNYVDGFRGLKMIGYQDFISLECGSIGDKKVTIPAAAKLMREQWEMA
ncbi:MAG TPA: sugar phosphate isomerase/epimerase [Planctomycetaceae bacterium]|nr:sugar phosphate isomerase/epimerase [Planctomycetaceae bacterium]